VVAQVETGVRRCPSCKSCAPAAVALCPNCGDSLHESATPGKRSYRLPVLLGGLLLALGLAIGAHRAGVLTSPTARCSGGEDPKVEWRTPETKPASTPGKLFQIEPTTVPFIKLADIRTTGNRTYGDKCDGEWGHIHDPVYIAVVREGANAYYNNPAQRVANDRVEVLVTAVLAHAGHVPQAIKDRYFPAGRALMVVHLFPNSVAEAAGLRPGDLVATYKGVALRAGRQFEMDAIAIVDNETVEILAIRDGREVTFSLVRRGREKLGYNYGEVPLLEAAP
jgi:hypothetical protein